MVASERSWPASMHVTPSTAAKPAAADQNGTAPPASTCPVTARLVHTVANTTARAVRNTGCGACGDMAPPSSHSVPVRAADPGNLADSPNILGLRKAHRLDVGFESRAGSPPPSAAGAT